MFPLTIRKMAPWFTAAIFLLAADRFFKVLFSGVWSEKVFSIFDGWLSFHFVANPYIALSIPFTGPILLAVLIIIVVILLIFSVKLVKNKEYRSAGLLTITIFCAISNILDRIRFGHVIDYIDVRYFSVMNIADIGITGSIIILAIFTFKKGGRSGQGQEEECNSIHPADEAGK